MLPSPRDVRDFRAAVEQGVPEPLRPGEGVEGLFRALDRAERCLGELARNTVTIALFGGTGVGKSTLLNAFAGAPISRPGERRPTTDRVVCYRHRETPVPGWLAPELLADPPAPVHCVTRLREVVILDLPDVDSRAADHREIVHRILPRLDLLLVVASVDKYGDRALYRELLALPQAPANLLFVLNATDRLRPEDARGVLDDFAQKLRDVAGLAEPRIHAVSARRALDSPGHPGDEGIEGLRRDIEALGEAAERRLALAANAEFSLQRVGTRWAQAAPPEDVEEWLRALRRVPGRLPKPDAALAQALEDRLVDAIGPWASDRALRSSWFPVGPLHFVVRKLRRRGARRPPFLAGEDPCRDLTERALLLPLRWTAREAAAALRSRRDRLDLTLPDLDPADAEFEASGVASWWRDLDRRSARWAWKLRQHLLPGALLGAALCRIAARAAQEHGVGLGRALGRSLLAAAASLDLSALVAVGAGLLVYYLLVYPYYLYRLERKIRREAGRGSRVYLETWRESFDRQWGRLFRERLVRAERWWAEAGCRFSALRLPREEGKADRFGQCPAGVDSGAREARKES